MFLFHNPLKTIWKALQQPHDWMNPSSEVQEMLEDKGYKFEFNDRAYGHLIMRTCDVTAPDGKKATGIDGADQSAMERYKQDYEAAVEKCRVDLHYF